MKKRKIASLFSGCGGMDLGFEGGFSVHKDSLAPFEDKLAKKADSKGFVLLKETDFETIFACDVYLKAQAAWNAYFGKRRDVTDVFHAGSIVDVVKDIRSGKMKLPGKVDVVTGGFPCNDFGGQEPGSEAAIGEFCSLTYDVSFPMFAKVDVNGENTHPIFAFLKAGAPGLLGTEGVKWNFTKFLIGRDGRVIQRYAPQDAPEKIAKDVEAALAG